MRFHVVFRTAVANQRKLLTPNAPAQRGQITRSPKHTTPRQTVAPDPLGRFELTRARRRVIRFWKQQPHLDARGFDRARYRKI